MIGASRLRGRKSRLRTVSKGELEMRRPMCEWAMRRMRRGRTQAKMARARRPVRPMGNHDHMTMWMVDHQVSFQENKGRRWIVVDTWKIAKTYMSSS